jgi:hypothetical protein
VITTEPTEERPRTAEFEIPNRRRTVMATGHSLVSPVIEISSDEGSDRERHEELRNL